MKVQPEIRHQRQREKGQTLALVAVSIVALLGFAALAIDVATLYVAHAEVQRTADAAALAGAKIIADSGITSLQTGDPNYGNLLAAAQLAATTEITQLIASRNQVAGATAGLVAGTPTYNFTQPNDPQVTVTLQRTSLPVFFAKIWGQRTVTAGATAVAEAYSPTGAAAYNPIAPRCVKPWLVVNRDGTGTQQFVTGGIVTATDLGKEMTVSSDCASGPPCALYVNSPPPPYPVYLVGQVTPNPSNVCPTSCGGATPFEQSVQCCDADVYSCGTGAAAWDSSINPNVASGSPTEVAGQCLIHATGSGFGLGQDTLTFPPTVPLQISTTYGPHPGTIVNTSQSIVTMPIIDPPIGALPVPPVNVVGFMQVFVNWVGPNGGITVTVLNIAACGAINNGAYPIDGGSGTSPVPVRLITPP
jgi:hypothetical protein